jgi:hypothetical protein
MFTEGASAMKDYDRKKLWARSGNICSFPDCNTELVPEKRANRVIGEEAHIKGEKPTAPRYDPNQSPEERDSYENRILLCPTHHTEIDADPQTWTVERLFEMKVKHEQQVIRNRQHPELVDELKKLVQRYEPSDEFLNFVVPDIIEDPAEVRIVRVDASKEKGVNTKIRVLPGQRIAFFARGLISYDGGHNFATPGGILCNEYGLPTMMKDADGNNVLVVWPHEQAYKTDGGELGRIGSLFGWINAYSPERAFLIGSRREIEVTEEGNLYLAVNDAKGTYSDNDGEFRVDIRIMETNTEWRW